MTDLITAETTGSAARSDGTIFSFGFDQGERDQTCLTIGRRMTHDGTLVITAALFGPDAKAVYDLVSALHAELAQARADAKAAVGLAIERAEVAAKNVATGFHDGISGDWHPYSGLTMINETCKAIRALAPEDAIAEVAKLRAELDAALSRRNESERVLVGMTLELEVFTAEVARLRDRDRVLVVALINRDGGSHDEDCKARRYGNSDRLCNCGHDEVVAALATDASAKAGGE